MLFVAVHWLMQNANEWFTSVYKTRKSLHEVIGLMGPESALVSHSAQFNLSAEQPLPVTVQQVVSTWVMVGTEYKRLSRFPRSGEVIADLLHTTRIKNLCFKVYLQISNTPCYQIPKYDVLLLTLDMSCTFTHEMANSVRIARQISEDAVRNIGYAKFVNSWKEENDEDSVPQRRAPAQKLKTGTTGPARASDLHSSRSETSSRGTRNPPKRKKPQTAASIQSAEHPISPSSSSSGQESPDSPFINVVDAETPPAAAAAPVVPSTSSDAHNILQEFAQFVELEAYNQTLPLVVCTTAEPINLSSAPASVGITTPTPGYFTTPVSSAFSQSTPNVPGVYFSTLQRS